MSRFALGQRVLWHGALGEVVGYFSEPAVTIRLRSGETQTVGHSMLEPAPPAPPAPPLPTEPGYYVAERPDYGGGAVVVELLNSPAGQWVDAGDRQYLTEEGVRLIGPLARLERRADTARAVLEYLQPVIPLDWARDTAAAFGVEHLYVADAPTRAPQ